MLLFCMILFFPTANVSALSCRAQIDSPVEEDAERYVGLNAFFRTFVTEFPKREAGTQSESEAADFLAGHLARFRLTAYAEYFGEGENFYQPFSYRTNDQAKNSRNVIGVKPSSHAQGLVVVGAHYDNYAERVTDENGNKLTGSQGASDNGTGVSVLMELVDAIGDIELPFDLIFCLFGAEEDGMQGAEAFLSSLTQEQRDSILLYVNLDSIGAGDHLYLYCDEVSTAHESYLRRLAEREGLLLAENPLDRKIQTTGWHGYPYSHIGLASDNAAFLSYGINSAGFFSFAWSSSKNYMAESDTKPTVRHTAKDNLNMLDELYGDAMTETMSKVATFVTQALREPDFVTEMRKSVESGFDYRWMLSVNLWVGISVALWIALIPGILCGYLILKGKISSDGKPEITVFGDGLDG